MIIIECIHCKVNMHISLDQAVTKMGNWDLEALEDDIGAVGIQDTGMEVDGDDSQKCREGGEDYSVSVIHTRCGKGTIVAAPEMRAMLRDARRARGV